MREIKFRIWNAQRKSFHYNGDGLILSNIAYLHQQGVIDINLSNTNCILQEFTGLKDKNGREIYEGDIIQVLDENNVFEVKFGKVKRDIVGFDTFTVYPVELNAFYFEQEGRSYFSITNNHLGKHDLEDTEIIGNIFENPEILE